MEATRITRISAVSLRRSNRRLRIGFYSEIQLPATERNRVDSECRASVAQGDDYKDWRGNTGNRITPNIRRAAMTTAIIAAVAIAAILGWRYLHVRRAARAHILRRLEAWTR